MQPLSGPLVDLAPFKEIPADEVASISTLRRAKGAKFSETHCEAETVLPEGPLLPPDEYKFHGSGGILDSPESMQTAKDWYEREVVQARAENTNLLPSPLNRPPNHGGLNRDQQDAYTDYAANYDRHAYVTGDAGTGKTALAREMVAMLADSNGKGSVRV